MGKTVPSYRIMMEGIINELSTYKRALHGEDKIVFDKLINNARKHASSGTITPTLDPMYSLFLSIIIEQQKEIDSLKNQIKNVSPQE